MCSLSSSACACAIFSSVACPAVQYISTLSYKRQDFRKKKNLTWNVCFDLLHNIWNNSQSKKNWVRYDQNMYIGLHAKYPLFLSDFNETWIFSIVFFLNYPNIKLHDNMPSGIQDVACGRTDITKMIVAFIPLCSGRSVVIHILPSKTVVQLLKNIFALHFSAACFNSRTFWWREFDYLNYWMALILLMFDKSVWIYILPSKTTICYTQ
jgi:hypothetical protein